MKNEAVEIKKIVLKIGDKDINLTIEQAKELKNLLDDLFVTTTVVAGGSLTVITSPPVIYQPYIPLPNPWWTTQIWCGDTGNVTSGITNSVDTLALTLNQSALTVGVTNITNI
jgi:hypothetical protein